MTGPATPRPQRRAAVAGAVALLAALAFAACGTRSTESAGAIDERRAPSTDATTSTSAAITSSTPTTTTAPTTIPPTIPPTSDASPTTVASTTTVPTTPVEPLPDPLLPATNRAFDALAAGNAAATLTVVRDGVPVLQRAAGTSIDGAPATSDTPMVIASVSKLVTAQSVARLAEQDEIDVDAPVPWSLLPVTAHPGWGDVTVRELLDHTSGMPVVRSSWFDGSDDCARFLPRLVADPPQSHRGRWTYSNGNYCVLGLLVEAVTGEPLDAAAQALLFDPLGADGPHLTTNGQYPTDIAYAHGVERLSRLGGAGTFIASTDDLAAMLASTTGADLETLRWPGILADQYGWGHTGTIDGAKSCAWVLELGRTTIAATVAGNSPSTGGEVCDRVVPAIAGDLGFAAGRPDRSPP